jgi:hypothetical protein
LKEKKWWETRNGTKCNNPYAVCHKSIKGVGNPSCFPHYNLDRFNSSELHALKLLKDFKTLDEMAEKWHQSRDMELLPPVPLQKKGWEEKDEPKKSQSTKRKRETSTRNQLQRTSSMSRLVPKEKEEVITISSSSSKTERTRESVALVLLSAEGHEPVVYIEDQMDIGRLTWKTHEDDDTISRSVFRVSLSPGGVEGTALKKRPRTYLITEDGEEVLNPNQTIPLSNGDEIRQGKMKFKIVF